MDEIHENQLGEVLPYQFEPVLNKNTGSSGAEAIPRASHFIYCSTEGSYSMINVSSASKVVRAAFTIQFWRFG